MADSNKEAADLLAAAATAYQKAWQRSDDDARKALRAVETALLEARRLRLNDAVSTIGNFFADIGKGVVTAQRQLDDESDRYVRELIAKKRAIDPAADADVAGAAMFRIPRVSAELKLSLEKSGGEGWSVVFYSKEQQTRELQQQSLQLEIVSVPVPAGYAKLLDQAIPAPPLHRTPAALENGGPPRGALGVTAKREVGGLESLAEGGEFESLRREEGVEFESLRREEEELESLRQEPGEPESAQVQTWPLVASAELRGEVREQVAKLAKELSPAQRQRVQKLLLPSWNRALVLASEGHCAFVVLVRDGKEPQLVLWQVVAQPASLTELYRMPATAHARRQTERLRGLLLALVRATRDVRQSPPREGGRRRR